MIEALYGVWNSATEALGLRHLPDVLSHPRGPHVETIRIPAFVQTQTYTCGPVAALMVVRHFRPEYPAGKVYSRADADPDYGTGVGRLVRVLRECGIRVRERSNLAFRDIVDAIDRGRPVITVVNTDRERVSHWVVLYGYGKKPSRVFLAANGPPVVGRREYRWDEFLKHHWTAAGFGLVCGRK